MTDTVPPKVPPFCPRPDCPFHKGDNKLWRYVRKGAFRSGRTGRFIQRYKCLQCGRFFSQRTFSAGYWLKRPDLLRHVAQRLVGCSGFRQIARELGVSPQTVARHASRLGRQAMLRHWRHWAGRSITEPVALDSFVSFEYSQYYPTHFHVLAGRESHYFYGFTESECRRSGRMTRRQKARRAELEARLGRPDPKSNEKEVATLLDLFTRQQGGLDLYTDEDQAYPRALRRLRGTTVRHRTISSRAARTPANPLFAINLLDLLLRHSSANHKRETIAFSKRRRSAIQRLWLFLLWRNYVKSFSEKRRDQTPAQKLGVTDRRWSLRELFRRRLFPERIHLPERWKTHYDGAIATRALGASETLRPRYAY
jgi:transposase-like protein